MENKVVFSIIVPVYNAEEFLENCISSILSQNFQNFELILIDDGSLDNSLSICKSYLQRDARVQVYHQENQGVSSARNLGLQKASGEYIFFVDADDFLKKDILFRFAETINRYGAQLVDIVFCGMQRYSRGQFAAGVFPDSYHGSASAELLYQLISNNLFGFCCNKIIKRNIIEKNSLCFSVDLRIREDQNFMMRLWPYVKTAACLNDVAYIYVEHSTSAMSREQTRKKTNIRGFFLQHNEVLRELTSFMKGAGVCEEQLLQYQHHYCLSICGEFLLNLSRKKMSEYRESVLEYQESDIYKLFNLIFSHLDHRTIKDYIIHYFNYGGCVIQTVILKILAIIK